MTAATAITVFHSAAEPGRFDAWAQDLLAGAAAGAGYTGSRVSLHGENGLDWAVEVTFDGADLLDAWLDGPLRQRLLAEGEALGFRRSSGDLVLAEDDVPPEGVAIFLHSVASGRQGEFVAAQAAIAAHTAVFPGHEGTAVFAPGHSAEWMSVVRFRTPRQLAAWRRSEQRENALPALRAVLTRDFSEVSRSAPFGATVRTDFGKTRITPAWKTAMVVLFCLYPTVMVLSRFLSPPLGRLGAQPWLTTFTGNVTSVVLMSWVLIPAVSRAFRRWLDPVDGAGPRVSVTGAALLILGYAALLVVFASVKQLQFWNN
jgi:uncharacterized protein